MYKVDTNHEFITETVGSMSNVIRKLHWYYEYTCEDNVIYHVHGDPITLPDPNSSDFVEFASLTEAQVDAWVDATLTSAQKTYYTTKLNEEITTWKNKVSEEKVATCRKRDLWMSEPKVTSSSAPWL